VTGSEPDQAALALCGGTVVVSLDPVEVVQADLVIAGGRVVVVGKAGDGVPCRDCSGTLVVPGNVCAHTHLYSALARGMPFRLEAPGSFVQILQRVWWRLDRALDETTVRMSALRGGLDALLAGTTTVVDHHASPNFVDGSLDVVADALEWLGLRSVMAYEVTDRDGPQRAKAGVAENARFLGQERTLTRGLVGAHASFTLSEETLEACVDLARSTGSGLHIHVAEDDADERDSLARFGHRVAQRLDKAGGLTDRALLAHGVHLDADERALVLEGGATIAHNSRSNMNNAVGHAALAHERGRVALGTDGIGGDMFAESQAAFFRAKEADPFTAPAWPLQRLAESARLAGRLFDEPLLGTLRPGAPADVTVLDYDAPVPVTADNLAGHWVFGIGSRHVRDVVVNGELVVADRRSTRVDEHEVAAESAYEIERLWARLDELPEHPFTPEGGA
jgi:putative selenium metabolism protein SsnA